AKTHSGTQSDHLARMIRSIDAKAAGCFCVLPKAYTVFTQLAHVAYVYHGERDSWSLTPK
ncbi:10338_t:CDS:1, partial [Gigaspora margarita]